MNLVRFLSSVLCLLSIASSAIAQTYPNKPVSLVVPYPAGGVSDPQGSGGGFP